MWALAYHFEPHYSPLRVMMHKLLMLATVLDDTYDNYATLHEIENFTQALQRYTYGTSLEITLSRLKCRSQFFFIIKEKVKK